MTCTCGGTAPGYPQHEDWCGKPETVYCYIDDCGQQATLVVPSYPDDIRLCADHAYLYTPEPWETR